MISYSLKGPVQAVEQEKAQKDLRDISNHTNSQASAAEVYRASGDHDQSLAYAELLIEHHPEDWNGYGRAAQELLALNRIEEAQANIQQGLQRIPHQISLLIIAAEVYRASGDHDQSLAYAELLIEHHPEDWNGYGRAAQELLALNRIEEAQANIQQGLQRIPHQISLLIIAAEVYRASGDHDQSLAYAELLIEHHPEDWNGYGRAAQELLALYKYAEAEEKIRMGSIACPDNANLRAISFSLNNLIGNYDVCLKEAEQAIRERPELIEGYAQKYSLLHQQGIVRKAEEVLDQAYQSAGGTRALDILARTHFRLTGRREEALLISAKIHDDSQSDSERACIELCKDLLVLNEIDLCLGKLQEKKIIDNNELIIIKRLLTLQQPRKFSTNEKLLINRLEIFPHYSDPNFNASIDDVLDASRKNTCVIMIHIGKCAGESIKNTLRRDFGGNVMIYEYHLFDSNLLIAELIAKSHACGNLFFVICTRDPMERWISSFNYELHVYKLKRLFYAPPKVHESYAHYPTAKSLVRALSKSDEKASEFAGLHHLAFGHMAMGISWYLPKETILGLPVDRSFLIRLEHLKNDYLHLQSFLRPLAGKGVLAHSLQRRGVMELNNKWKSEYRQKPFSSLSDLSPSDAGALRSMLEKDYESIDTLSEIFKDSCNTLMHQVDQV
jgi:tetratricopeptide (TPR) repeat protein